MKHRIRHNQLGRNTNQLKALRRGLVQSVFAEGKVVTTLQKAKAVVPEIDKVLTAAKKGGISGKRQVVKMLGGHQIIDRLFTKIVPMVGSRTSGFTRITKTGSRFSDGTEMAVLELVDYKVEALVPVEKTAVKEEKAEVEKPKVVEKVTKEKIQRAKPKNIVRPKAIGNK